MGNYRQMKSRVIFIVIFYFLGVHFVSATQQQPDILHYKSYKLNLETGWGHPSRLETYFSQNNLEYLFFILHTANYRGHVATWKVNGGKLYITKIDIEGKNYSPLQYKVTSKDKVRIQEISEKDTSEFN